MYAVIKPLSLWGLAMALAGAAAPASAQSNYAQTGPKLVGTGATIPAGTLVRQGGAVALSADGNTMIVGGAGDNADTGAAWVYVRANGAWVQQGDKLVGSFASGAARQGVAVALSADGNTAIVGGYQDAGGLGAAWIFVRNGGAWSQQGVKLVGANAVGAASQGISVALSADGNTAIIGGSTDNGNNGAAWIFTRINAGWSPQGGKLVGTGNTGAARLGVSVALSADGNTAIAGGASDNANVGAAWIFTRCGVTWTQQGGKLTGGDASPPSLQGGAVALAADGNTAIVGGRNDGSDAGAAWIWTRSGATWSQQGSKLVGTGGSAAPQCGSAVALSADGNTALVGAFADVAGTGAAWVWTRQTGAWTQRGPKLTGSGSAGFSFLGVSVALSAAGDVAVAGGPNDASAEGAVWTFIRRTGRDFDANATADILWRDTSGWLATAFGNTPLVGMQLISFVAPNWSVAGIRDFNGDGKADILWRETTSGDLAVWFMDGKNYVSGAGLGNVPPSWTIAGVGDFNGDGKGDLLWRGPNGEVVMWFMNGATVTGAPNLGTVSLNYTIAAVGDLNGDGKSDIVWRDAAGNVPVWLMNGAALVNNGASVGIAPTDWQVVGTGDFNGDGNADILWRGPAGEVAAWLMNGTTILAGPQIGQAPLSWQTQGTGDFNNDGKADILWRDTSGGFVAVWHLNGGSLVSGPLIGALPVSWAIQTRRGIEAGERPGPCVPGARERIRPGKARFSGCAVDATRFTLY